MIWTTQNGYTVDDDGSRLVLTQPPLRFTTKTVIALLVTLYFFCQISWLASRFVRSSGDGWSIDRVGCSVMVLTLTVFLIQSAWNSTRREYVVIDANAISLSIQRLGRLSSTMRVPIDDMSKAYYGLHSASKYGSTLGLVFEGSHTFKVASGILATEGDRMLEAMQKYGVPVLRDSALPMVADIESKGWFVNPWSRS